MDPEPRLPVLNERVLSTLNTDGSRRWLRPRVSPGRFLSARRSVAWGLIVLFVALPYIPVGGKPALLLDLVRREFTFFGRTLQPTDTVLLALLVVGIVVGLFLVTALLGRIWCGWACPQTVYLEFIYRPIERLFDGPPGKDGAPGKRSTPLRTVLKYASFGAISFALANVFLAYFVGVEALGRWITQSPIEHPAAFVVMASTTALMFFDFTWFREQTCIIACPYGRLQSVLVDRDSLIISYDTNRGEPRGKLQKGAESNVFGDCIDCRLCVDTCPTGIDIREGLRMECVACAQCIDACDAVMKKIKKPVGLVRYTSQARMAGEGARLLRPRVVIYPLVLLVIAGLFGVVLSRTENTVVTLVRGPGAPFMELPDGRISNPLRIKIANRARDEARYDVQVVGGGGITMALDENPVVVERNGLVTKNVAVLTPRDAFQAGRADVSVRVTDGKGFDTTQTFHLLGPAGPKPATPAAPSGAEAPSVGH